MEDVCPRTGLPAKLRHVQVAPLRGQGAPGWVGGVTSLSLASDESCRSALTLPNSSSLFLLPL